MLASPYLPAYCCYGLVALLGCLVARGRVYDRLGQHRDRWAFMGTWSIFLAYLWVPILLFWFLDYTGVISDTAFFAALIVGLGYRQIFAGKSQDIALPPQTPRFWQPFEKWIERVADKIETKNKVYRDHFDESVRRYLLKDQQRIQDFQNLVLRYSDDPQNLQAGINSILTSPQVPGANRRLIQHLWKDFRKSQPREFGYLLYKNELITWGRYWRWQKAGRAKLISWAVSVLAVIFVLMIIFFSLPSRNHVWKLPYHQWRFNKANATSYDRYRAQQYLGAILDTLQVDDKHRELAQKVLLPVVSELGFEEIPLRQADDILRLVFEFRTPVTKAVVIPVLIESLRTKNADVRSRIHQTLKDVEARDHPGSLNDQQLVDWHPGAKDTPGQIDEFVQKWRAWWASKTSGEGAAEAL